MTTRERVLEAIEANPGVTRREVVGLTGLTGNKSDPAGMRLWLAGEIEPDSEVGWEQALARRFTAVGWRRVEPDRREEVAARARSRTPRNADPSAEEKAQEVMERLEDPIVSRIVRQLTKEGGASPAAEKRAGQALRSRQEQARQEARKADRDKAADREFKRALGTLWEARGAVAAIDAHLIEERARVTAGEPRKIADWDWLVALRDVRDIIHSFGHIWANIRDLSDTVEPCPACGATTSEARHLAPFVIEAEAVEVEGDEKIVDAEVVT